MSKSVEEKHKEMLVLLLPLVEFMDANKFNYLIVAGKEGTAARYLRVGDFSDLGDILSDAAKSHESIHNVLKNGIKNEEVQTDVL